VIGPEESCTLIVSPSITLTMVPTSTGEPAAAWSVAGGAAVVQAASTVAASSSNMTGVLALLMQAA